MWPCTGAETPQRRQLALPTSFLRNCLIALRLRPEVMISTAGAGAATSSSATASATAFGSHSSSDWHESMAAYGQDVRQQGWTRG